MSVSLDPQTARSSIAGIFGLLLLANCPQPPRHRPAAVPGFAPGARIWFYRAYDPSLSRNVANVDFNDTRMVARRLATARLLSMSRRGITISPRKASGSTPTSPAT